MNKIICTLLSFIFLYPVFTFSQEEIIELKEDWKFMPGDNLAYAEPDYDDSKWKEIRVDKIWEEQGYDTLDGFVWYRIKVVIPSRLKENAYLKDSLKIFPGKINNYDQAFINGKPFGINGKNVPAGQIIDTSFLKAPIIYWDLERRYTLPVNDSRILWDKENVLAFRVFDQGGQGGIYTGNATISMVNIREYLVLEHSQTPFKFKNNKISKSFNILNISPKLGLDGMFIISAVNKTDGKKVLNKTEQIDLQPLESRNINITIEDQGQSTYISYRFEFSKTKEAVAFVEETPYILTPAASPEPKINGALVYGQRVNRPFLYKVAATGNKPLQYDALNLPEGLSIDRSSGIISGIVKRRGEYNVTLIVSNNLGKAENKLMIIIGDKLALTPPLGWNSWNCWGLSVDQEKVLSSARAFIEKGLADHGWSFINIDDGWEIFGDSAEPKRDEKENIIVNDKFPSMKNLADNIHSLGLKLGIYSSPGPLTCGGYTASYQHEQQDALSFASWGIDYLKYDWCSYDRIAKDTSREERIKPYRVMQEALSNINRDIVYSLCQYGMSNVWEWGESVDGNLWRTTGDITDTWESMSSIGFNQVSNQKYAGPGHWNDPDMLVVGWVGWGPNLHPTKLTPDEQYTHISLWSLLSAPLLIGCDLTRLDEFTLNLLTNDEVLAVNQDPQGIQASPIIINDSIQVWKKPLAGGNFSIGIFNLSKSAMNYELNFSEAGISSGNLVRDIWRQKDLGKFENKIITNVPSHGVILLKLTNKIY